MEMRALIIGLGSIGRRHLSNLNSLGVASEIVILRRPASRDQPIEARSGRVIFDLVEAIRLKPDIALITGPTSSHVELALALAREGVHLFIEKPLSNSLDNVDDLIAECRTRSLTLMVGYNFRFYRPLQLVKEALLAGQIGRVLTVRADVGQFLPDWRPNSDYRAGVTGRSSLGGGVVLELSHELDYVCWLAGEPESVFARISKLSELEIDVEDTAQISFRITGGSLASIHMDMVDRAAHRSCRIVGTQGTIHWNGLTHQVRLFSEETSEWKDLHPAADLDRNEMYASELRHFIECVESGRRPLVTGEDGRRVLEIALAAKRSSLEGRVIES